MGYIFFGGTKAEKLRIEMHIWKVIILMIVFQYSKIPYKRHLYPESIFKAKFNL